MPLGIGPTVPDDTSLRTGRVISKGIANYQAEGETEIVFGNRSMWFVVGGLFEFWVCFLSSRRFGEIVMQRRSFPTRENITSLRRVPL